MPNFTPNYNLAKPIVNSAVDQDLWGGELNGDMDIIDTTMADLQTQIDGIGGSLPIGSIYMNYSDSTNPATLLGYGTWTAIVDKFLIGASGTYPAGSTGGATTHTLTAAEIPALSYSIAARFGSTNTSQPVVSQGDLASTVTSATGAISTNAGGGAHSILNPYVAVYMWYRSA